MPTATLDDTLEQQIRAGQILPGMSFNQRVWALTSRIPKGRVTTYAALARAVGSPGASRAIGNAMNKNPYAPGVPCHRVVGSNGSLTGYAHGLDRKRQILTEEGVEVLPGNRVAVADIYDFTDMTPHA